MTEADESTPKLTGADARPETPAGTAVSPASTEVSATTQASPTTTSGSAVSTELSEASEESPVSAGPKVVRRVVCSYKLGWLPGDWLQTWRRLDRVFARADLKVKATLAPLEDLPEDTDILVVPPELRDAAREMAPPGLRILVTPASAAAGAFADLVARLEAGTEFTAEKLTVEEKEGPKIVSYRGHTLLD
jgi:hypothetical protein